jgi:hypothetical protein
MKAAIAKPALLEIPSDCGVSGGSPATERLQGVWQTAGLTEGQIVQAFVSAGGSEADGHAFFAQLGGGAERTAAFRLDFEHGGVDQYESPDGGTFSHGDHRIYRVDGRTLSLSAGGCTATFSVTLSGDRLQLRPGKECQDGDRPYTRTIYGSFPYTRHS